MYSASGINLTEYWGNGDMRLSNGTGFFEVDNDRGTWWFVTPNGYAFYSVGCLGVRPDTPYMYSVNILNKYPGGYEEWANATRERYREWGFNTIGPNNRIDLFEDDQIPHVYKFKFQHMGRGIWNRRIKKVIPDVFDPYFWELVEQNISEVTAKFKNDSYLIGYELGNEMHWEPNPEFEGYPGDKNTLLETYLSIPYERFQPGKIKAVEFLIDRYDEEGIEVFNKVWKMKLGSFDELYDKEKLGRTGWKAQHFIPRVKEDIQDFAQLVAKWFFKNTTDLIKKYDPNHLTLGVRFHAWGAPCAVIRECGKYCDVVSINYYRNCMLIYDPDKYIESLRLGTVPLNNWMKEYYDITGKPLLVGEFSGAVTKLHILKKILKIEKSPLLQLNKGIYYTWYSQKCLEAPYVIGHHGFYKNELVNLNDENISMIGACAENINSQIYEIHGS